MINRLIRWWRSIRYLRYFVIADSNDNSITFSRKLYKHIELNSHVENAKEFVKVFVFKVPELNTYAFMINPELNQETQLADIQYNSKYKTIGFESLLPTVNRIFNDYGLPFGLKAKLTVTIRHLPNGKLFYNIEDPRT